MTVQSMFLTDQEVDDICEGLGRNSHAAKIKRLQGMGLIVNRKPNGRPLVVRAHAEAVLSGRAAAAADELAAAGTLPPGSPRPTTGDRAAVIALFSRKKAA